MKKILVVLLVLAVATGVFAQEGEWSFNGTAQVGVALDFDPVPSATGDKPLATSSWSQYNRLYDGWDYLMGSFGINYSRDGFGAGVTVRTAQPATSTFIGSLNYGGENFNFSVESDLAELISGSGSNNMKQLWGNYSFLDGLVFLEASYVRGWAGDQFWASDTTGAFRNWNGKGNNVINGPFVGDHTFTMTDGDWNGGSSTYLAADVRLQGINFGLMIRDLFWGGQTYVDVDDPDIVLAEGVPMTFTDDVLKNMIFGVKLNMSPIEIAAQFLMKDYGVYLGGKWFVGPVTVGLSFMGILGETKSVATLADFGDDTYVIKKTYTATENTKMKVGGGVNYDAEGFGAAIKGFLSMDGNKSTKYTSELGIEPGFYYNVIPTHLQFKLDAGFYFFGRYANGTKVETGDFTAVQFALQPQLFWNFLGTGAGGYGGTGLFLRYRIVGGDATKAENIIGLNNKFDVNFKWSF